MEKLRTVTLPAARQVSISVTEEHLVGYGVREGALENDTPENPSRGMVIKAIWNTPDVNGSPHISSRRISDRLAADIMARAGHGLLADELRDETKLQ